MFSRTIENTIKEKFNSGKAIIVVGARQVGKTTLLKEILTDKEFLFLDADDPSTRSLLQNPTTEQIRTFLPRVLRVVSQFRALRTGALSPENSGF
ncbi:MAG: AAA family ATPase [Draconibacterium sp.]